VTDNLYVSNYANNSIWKVTNPGPSIDSASLEGDHTADLTAEQNEYENANENETESDREEKLRKEKYIRHGHRIQLAPRKMDGENAIERSLRRLEIVVERLEREV